MTTRRLMRQIVEEAGLRSGTDLENRVAYRLHRGGHKFTQQHAVGRYRLDFAWPKVKVAVEADGWHHRSPEGAAKDAERDSWLRSQDWIVLRIDDRYGEDSIEDQDRPRRSVDSSRRGRRAVVDMTSPTDLLDDLPDLQAFLTGIPVVETKYRSWRDAPLLVNPQMPHPWHGSGPYLLVGDAKFFAMRIEAQNQVRDIVRTGLRDVIDWLAEAGVRI